MQERRFHLERMQRLMREHQLDALLVASPLAVRYFTGYHHWLLPVMRHRMTTPGGSDDLCPTMAVVDADGRVTLLTQTIMAAHAQGLPIDRVVPYEAHPVSRGVQPLPMTPQETQTWAMWQQPISSDPAAALSSVVVSLGSGAKIGYESAAIPASLLHAITTTGTGFTGGERMFF